MPTMLDLIEAAPRCQRRRIKRRGPHGVHFTCLEPMRYVAAANAWRCECGNVVPGLILTEQRRAA